MWCAPLAPSAYVQLRPDAVCPMLTLTHAGWQVSMATVKNFVLLGDVQKSVYFLHFREEKDGLGAGGKPLTQLAKDFDDLQVRACTHWLRPR